MIETVELNKISTMNISDARKAIVNNLILENNRIDNEISKLKDDLKENQELLEQAKLDGDLSENSAYSEAITKVTSTFGRILKYQSLKRAMEFIEEPDYVLATRDYKEMNGLIESLQQSDLTTVVGQTINNYFDGDISKIKDYKRSDLQGLIQELNKLKNNHGSSLDESDIELYNLFMSFIDDYIPRPYIKCGKVVLYSTVKVEINGEDYIFMICPDNISFPDKGIVAANTEIGKRLLTNRVTIGSIQNIRDNLRFIIKEIY